MSKIEVSLIPKGQRSLMSLDKRLYGCIVSLYEYIYTGFKRSLQYIKACFVHVERSYFLIAHISLPLIFLATLSRQLSQENPKQSVKMIFFSKGDIMPHPAITCAL